MLEKIAEAIRLFDIMPVSGGCLALCDFCPKADDCQENPCTKTDDASIRLMLARWAVLQVAGALEKWVAEIDRTNGVDLGDVEALGGEFMNLYYEVKKAEAKEAAHE